MTTPASRHPSLSLFLTHTHNHTHIEYVHIECIFVYMFICMFVVHHEIHPAVCCNVLPCVAMCCRVLCCRVLLCIAVYCSESYSADIHFTPRALPPCPSLTHVLYIYMCTCICMNMCWFIVYRKFQLAPLQSLSQTLPLSLCLCLLPLPESPPLCLFLIVSLCMPLLQGGEDS